MRKKVFSLISIISLVIASLFVLWSVGNVYAYEPDELVDSNWLISEGVPYESDTIAGSTSGYGKFLLGQDDVTLTTNALEGFTLVGWQIVYTDSPTNSTYIDSSDLTIGENNVASKTIQFGDGENQVDIRFDYLDTDNDGYYDQGNFNISKVFENLQVVAVFDFIYYNVEVSELVDISAIDSYPSEKISNTDNTIYYTAKSNNGTYTTYSNAIISFNKNGENKLYYYGDLYSYDNEFFTLHNTMTELSTEQRIDYTIGAYRLFDEVEGTFGINIIDQDLYSSINIDIDGVVVMSGSNELNLVQDGDENAYSITNDQYGRTTTLSFTFNIINSYNQESVLKIEYDNLYLANIEAYIDEVACEGENFNDVLQVITVTFFYSQVSDNVYFIKNASENNGNAFRVVAAPKISKVVDAISYDYYQFGSIDDVVAMTSTYPDVNQNITIKVNYNSINYKVDFEFRLYDSSTGNISIPSGDFNLENTIYLTRGDQFTINKSDTSNNVGYSFYGFAYSEFQVNNNTSIDVEIDYDKPQNYTILMLYEYIDYSIKFMNYDQISLNYNSIDYYPISRTTLSVARGSISSTDTITSDDLRQNAQKAINFDLIANIWDSLSIYSELINGFYLLGYKIGGVGDYVNNNNSIEFILSSDIISQYANDNDEIEIYVYEDYAKYTLTYYIEASTDTYLDEDVIMADLTYDTTSTNIQIDDSDPKVYIITIGGLKLYDTVNLKAKGKNINNLELQEEYTYMFVRFTENDKTNLVYSYDLDTDTYTHSETILRDYINIKVVYTMPSARLLISTDRENAYDLNNLAVYQDGAPLTITDSTVIVEAGKNIQVLLNPNGVSDIIAFGYNLIGYTLTSEGVETFISVNDLADPYTFAYNVTSSNMQYLVINFIEVEYHLSILQSGGGAGYDGQYVNFDNQNYKLLSIDDRSFSFDMPEGYYASTVSFIAEDGFAYEYEPMKQTNAYQGNQFDYNLTIQELTDLVGVYGIQNDGYVELNLLVVYQIHTYSITIDFELTNPKNNDYDSMVNYPIMIIQYSYQGLPQEIMGIIANNRVVFEDIPYNCTVIISVSGNIQNGLVAFGWTNAVDEAPNYSHSNSSLTIPNIRQNEYFKYKLSYEAYTINLILDDINRGNPTVLINDVPSNQISLYDNLKINMNANKNNGFRFDNLYYYVYSYQPYVYSDDTWAQKYFNLYIYSNETGYVLNSSSEYNPNTVYFEYTLTQVNYNDSTTYEDGLFDVDNYYIDGGIITFYIEYEYIEISLINDSSNYSDVTLIRGDISIEPSDYATYRIMVTTNGEVRELLEGETVNYLDSVEIFIKFNDARLNENEIYNLSRGVYLAEISMLNNNYTFEATDQEGEYKFGFNISDIISSVPDDGQVIIYYRYLVGEKEITLTTNIDAPTFYTVNNVPRFVMSYDNNMYGFDAQIYSSSGQSFLINNLQFLGKTRINYDFQTIGGVNYAQFFYIKDVKIYDEMGDLLLDSQTATREDYDQYGLAITYDEEGNIQSIDVRFIENIVIKLQVQPNILYNSSEDISVEYINGVYVFTSTFNCDETGEGIEQALSIGTSNDSNIQSSEFILNFLMNENAEYNIFYYDSNGMQVDPTNVGDYNVELRFNDTGEYSWLSSIELSYEVVLRIVPRPISVNYALDETFTKTYDGSASYDPTRLLQYLVFTDGAVTIDYEKFTITQNYSANITYLINGVETPIATANEDVFYNITISNINLAYSQFNNNFVLTNDTLTISSCIKVMKRQLNLIGVEVNDKVYDGSADATIKQDADIRLQGALANDDVHLLVDQLIITFSDASIGANKQVTVNSEDALIGADALNYKLNTSTISATIYPYSVSTHIEGVGDITISNRRGAVDPSLADLIPIGASLKVEIIEPDTNEYVSIYDKIVRYLSNSRVFVIGYKLKFETNGVSQLIDNNLYLTVPNEDRLTGVVWLTGEQSGTLEYEEQGDNVTVDLAQMSADVNTIIITQQRRLLELWQIILIIIFILLLLLIIIIILLIIRKKKKEKYSENEKI